MREVGKGEDLRVVFYLNLSRMKSGVHNNGFRESLTLLGLFLRVLANQIKNPPEKVLL